MNIRPILFISLLSAVAPVAADELIDVQGHAVWVDNGTTLVVDDEVLPPGSAVPQKPGLRTEVRYPQALMAQPGPHGVVPAATVVFSYAVRGSVTSTVPLRVLGQEVTVTADTGATGLPGGTIANIALGDHLDVSGYVDTNSSLLASFIEYLPTPTPRWLLSGYVTGVNGNEITLGPQDPAWNDLNAFFGHYGVLKCS